jgi:hypothetical protein
LEDLASTRKNAPKVFTVEVEKCSGGVDEFVGKQSCLLQQPSDLVYVLLPCSCTLEAFHNGVDTQKASSVCRAVRRFWEIEAGASGLGFRPRRPQMEPRDSGPCALLKRPEKQLAALFRDNVINHLRPFLFRMGGVY